MNASAIWDYENAPKEHVGCNLCGGPQGEANQGTDRYGYSVWTHTCPTCGLIYISPRMTAEAYSRFYRGPYRALTNALYRKMGEQEFTDAMMRRSQRIYAIQTIERLAGYVPATAKTLLDIGGSTGVVARVFSVALDLKPTVVDPAAHELPADFEVFPVQAEHFEPAGRTWDVVTMCQTVDHLLDVASTLAKVRALLADGGLFFVDIVDCSGPYQVKIDHPFYLTPKTMERFLRQAGFRIRDIRRAADVRHVQFYCR